jgi:NAD(P)-dependent dehydrogenase (short-subunit alcohol dehydrogenase family)
MGMLDGKVAVITGAGSGIWLESLRRRARGMIRMWM